MSFCFISFWQNTIKSKYICILKHRPLSQNFICYISRKGKLRRTVLQGLVKVDQSVCECTSLLPLQNHISIPGSWQTLQAEHQGTAGLNPETPPYIKDLLSFLLMQRLMPLGDGEIPIILKCQLVLLPQCTTYYRTRWAKSQHASNSPYNDAHTYIMLRVTDVQRGWWKTMQIRHTRQKTIELWGLH